MGVCRDGNQRCLLHCRSLAPCAVALAPSCYSLLWPKSHSQPDTPTNASSINRLRSLAHPPPLPLPFILSCSSFLANYHPQELGVDAALRGSHRSLASRTVSQEFDPNDAGWEELDRVSATRRAHSLILNPPFPKTTSTHTQIYKQHRFTMLLALGTCRPSPSVFSLVRARLRAG